MKLRAHNNAKRCEEEALPENTKITMSQRIMHKEILSCFYVGFLMILVLSATTRSNPFKGGLTKCRHKCSEKNDPVKTTASGSSEINVTVLAEHKYFFI